MRQASPFKDFTVCREAAVFPVKLRMVKDDGANLKDLTWNGHGISLHLPQLSPLFHPAAPPPSPSPSPPPSNTTRIHPSLPKDNREAALDEAGGNLLSASQATFAWLWLCSMENKSQPLRSRSLSPGSWDLLTSSLGACLQHGIVRYKEKNLQRPTPHLESEEGQWEELLAVECEWLERDWKEKVSEGEERKSGKKALTPQPRLQPP